MGSAPWTPFKALSWGLYSAPPDPQLARAMTFACRAQVMTSSLNQQTFGGGGGEDHMKFSQTKGGINNFSAPSKGRSTI